MPTQESLKIIRILRTSSGQEIFREDFGTVAQPLFQLELNKISELEWVIPATNQGRRIVKQLQPETKVLVFDQDREDAIIEGAVGGIIEVQYLSRIGRIKKFKMTLR